MPYRRTGTCNMCGECCGFPHPDGTQIRPWPAHIIEGTESWNEESILANPFFQVFPPPRISNSRANVIDVDEKKFRYTWRPEIGLCRTDGNVACPFLLDVRKPGEHKCGIYGTRLHWFWQHACENTPPLVIEDEEGIATWKQTAPSCSYTYILIEPEDHGDHYC